MTFPAELERLLKSGDLQRASILLTNHADAILGLVRAAEEMANPSGYRDFIVAHNELRQALAKLNGGKG